jgi:hypothetical protein
MVTVPFWFSFFFSNLLIIFISTNLLLSDLVVSASSVTERSDCPIAVMDYFTPVVTVKVEGIQPDSASLKPSPGNESVHTAVSTVHLLYVTQENSTDLGSAEGRWEGNIQTS